MIRAATPPPTAPPITAALVFGVGGGVGVALREAELETLEGGELVDERGGMVVDCELEVALGRTGVPEMGGTEGVKGAKEVGARLTGQVPVVVPEGSAHELSPGPISYMPPIPPLSELIGIADLSAAS